jgi:hypothetical protein
MKVFDTDPNLEPCELAPPEAFSDELAPIKLSRRLRLDIELETGPNSRTLARVILSRTAGEPDPPTPAEVYKAMAATERNERQRYAVETWITSATPVEMIDAWIERAYSWRMLVRAMHECPWPWYHVYRTINFCANRPELVPDDALPIEYGYMDDGYDAEQE